MPWWYLTTVKPSKPDYAPATAGNDMDFWTCQEWKQYHDNIKAAEGIEVARETLHNEVERISSFANFYNCKYDCDWNDYMRGEGYDVGWIASDVWCAANELSGGVRDTAKGVGNVGNVVGSILDTKFLVGAGILSGVIYYYGQKENK